MVRLGAGIKYHQAVNEVRGPFRVCGGTVNEGCCGLDGTTAVLSVFTV